SLVLGALLGRHLLRNPATRERFDAAWLRLPLIGRLARSYNAARFASTLAMLAGAGVRATNARFKGDTPALIDVMAGRIQAIFTTGTS
ncbi:MAG: hypothetical protein RSC66_12410, partial [Comamonas sp.]